jgi:RNA polymerase sigma-70 factor (ECF subfamily)
MGAELVPVRGAEAPPGAVSFTEIFERELSYVWHALRRLGVAGCDLEDVTQQVFMQVHGQLAAYDARRPLRPWLFAFAFNAASNYRALARHRLESSVRAPETSDPTPAADEQLISRQERELAELALQHVALDRRGVLLLHEIEGHGIPEIANALGIPLNTAYSRLRLARREYERAVRRLRVQRGEA